MTPGAPVTVFLGGDAMTGRGVDQILAHPSSPELHEPFVSDAREYVRLAELASGAVPRSADPASIWGDALVEWNRVAPLVGVVNLETSITRSDDYCTGKEIHYRMHPDNVGCLTFPRPGVCALANNHVLDYGRQGLIETLETLEHAGVMTAGAGRSHADAWRPAACSLPGGGRLLVSACGHESSGIPDEWAARGDLSGVALLSDLGDEAAAEVASRATAGRRPGDIVVLSIHWGSNWGYDVPPRHVGFAHRLIDGGVDIVYGHSSHHVRPIEIYRGKLILYGCGDLIDDYEGISGHQEYRGNLVLLFFPSLDPETGRLVALHMTPMQIRWLRLFEATSTDARWLCDTLTRISAPFKCRVQQTADGTRLFVLP